MLKTKNILSVDLEDWFHPEYVRDHVTERHHQIIQSVNRILDILSKHNVQLTFFVVGEIAEKFPELIEKLDEQGHEVAFHGFHHKLLWELDPKAFENELKRYDEVTRPILHEKCLGFRAPSCSIDNRTIWALDLLEKFGYVYDSSVFPMKTPLYGVFSAPVFPYHPAHDDVTKEADRRIMEFPLLVYPMGPLRIPAAGGFFLRFLPLNLIKAAVKKMNSYGKPAVLFFHPWEMNPSTPRLNLGVYKSFVTYHLLSRTEEKMENLLANFRFSSFRSLLESNEFS